ncbi:hypothetical protein GWI33_015996 [Rhynchophorus ferrugineus]|uniref:Uncharacterized protein n=1 Tax=Rhynchophorus ferrugineus TaxID=354439 RepID=A0A834I496_RHYFE|nr:hypothetical protein GWI33_015996 [Rhynchophorus ferrugineus]
MSTIERKEYQETRIMRSRSPVRNVRSSNQNLSQFDSNLDHLLEDLQNTVSRPGSSLAHNNTSTYKETSKYITNNTDGYGKTNSLNRVANIKPSNPVTEYSSDDAYTYTSPDGREKVQTYKKEKYMYGKNIIERDIEPERTQLDSLLEDLQQAKKSSYTEKESYNSIGPDPGFQTKTINRELHYGDTPPSARTRTIERHEEKSYKKDGYSSEGTYGDLRPLRTISPSPSSRTSTLSKQTKLTNVQEYPVRVLDTPVPDIDPEVLAHLDPSLHPPGNTKVTTTIKTYTYEIPGSGPYPTQVKEDTSINEQYLDKSEKYLYSPNNTITTPSKSFVYNKIENQENVYQKSEPPHVGQSYQEIVQDDVSYYPPYQKPTPPGGYTTVKETITTRNYQPGYQPEYNPPGPNQTYVYNESTTTKNIQNEYPQPRPETREYIINKETNIINKNQPVYPPQETTREYVINKETNIINKNQPVYPPPETTREYVINKETNMINRNQPPMSERGYPVYNPPPPAKNTYIIKETHTTNYQNGYPPNRQQSPPRDVETFPPQVVRKPQEPINIHYSYKSTNTTENRYKGGYPENPETQTLLPRRFPTDEEPDGTPKRVEELMATIGNEPPNSPLNAGYNAHEKEIAHKKVVESLKQQNADIDDLQKKEPPTKNVTGPPVYYPPGHEMFAKKEEGGGAWRAQGEYARGSGKYMYEAESSSKTKTKKGMAVVPVCLPLCCGLPCTLL